MSVEHVTQRILNIRSVAIVAMVGLCTSTTITHFPAKHFIICEIKCEKWVISVPAARLVRHFQDIKICIIISMGWD